MLIFNEITIAEKKLFDNFFALKQYDISEFTFTNLYMWRKAFNIKYTVVDNLLCISAISEDGLPFYFMPVGNGDLGSFLDKLTTYGESLKNPFFKSLSARMVEELENARPGLFTFTPDPGLSDYVYLSEDLIELKGKKYHSKRNHIHKFNSLYEYRYMPYEGHMMDKCINALNEWYRKNNHDDELLLNFERDAIMDMLCNFEVLNFKGGVIEIDGKIAAFTFGEKLNSDTVVVHVEKANTDFEGAYTVINQNFCQYEWRDIKYINREEDMDIEGLRKAKKSYHPVRMVDKFDAYLR